MRVIQMVDLQKQYLRLKPEIDQAMQEVLEQAIFINGPQVKEFARQLELYNNINHVVTCGNGTDALQLALMALDLAPGAEVIVPVFTFGATAEAIALLGLTPVWADVDPNTFTIDPAEVERKLTIRTAAIMPVHLFGQCADMEALLSLAQKYTLPVIEDAAQAIGAEYTLPDGTRKKAGTMGTVGITSFFPAKNLGGFGDGGALYTDHEQLARKARLIANHGQQTKYRHEAIGINSRLDTLQAAVLLQKLQYLDDFTTRRRRAAAYYHHALQAVPGLRVPPVNSHSTHVYQQYTLQILNGRRDEIRAQLAAKGIPSMVYYPELLSQQPAFKRYHRKNDVFPVADSLCRRVLSLPMHTELDEEQLEYITTTLIALL